MVSIGSVGEMLTGMWAVIRAGGCKETDVLRDELPGRAMLALPFQTYTREQLRIGTFNPLVTQTRTGYAKGEPFRQNRRAAGYSPLGPGELQMPVSSHAARSPR